MEAKLKQYNMLKRIVDEKFNSKQIELKTALDKHNDCIRLSEEVKKNIEQCTDELNSKFKSLNINEFNTFELHNKNLRALIQHDFDIDQKIEKNLTQVNDIETKCAILNIEIKKYKNLIDNLSCSINKKIEKKQSSELDELWLLRWNRT